MEINYGIFIESLIVVVLILANVFQWFYSDKKAHKNLEILFRGILPFCIALLFTLAYFIGYNFIGIIWILPVVCWILIWVFNSKEILLYINKRFAGNKLVVCWFAERNIECIREKYNVFIDETERVLDINKILNDSISKQTGKEKDILLAKLEKIDEYYCYNFFIALNNNLPSLKSSELPDFVTVCQFYFFTKKKKIQALPQNILMNGTRISDEIIDKKKMPTVLGFEGIEDPVFLEQLKKLGYIFEKTTGLKRDWEFEVLEQKLIDKENTIEQLIREIAIVKQEKKRIKFVLNKDKE